MNTIIFLTNGQSVQTTTSSATDLAGLINANANAVNDGDPLTAPQAIYSCVDAMTGKTQYIVTAHIVNVTTA